MKRQVCAFTSRIYFFANSHSVGAFGAHPDHDAHLLSTLSAIQIMIIQNAVGRLDTERIVNCTYNICPERTCPLTFPPTLDIQALQQPSGAFAGDAFGEIDTRFICCALLALSLLGRLDAINKDNAVSYIVQCRNFDGGFGGSVGAESHAAQGASDSLRFARIRE